MADGVEFYCDYIVFVSSKTVALMVYGVMFDIDFWYVDRLFYPFVQGEIKNRVARSVFVFCLK